VTRCFSYSDEKTAKFLLSLVRKLYESSKGKSASAILTSYGVRVYVYETKDLIRKVNISEVVSG